MIAVSVRWKAIHRRREDTLTLEKIEGEAGAKVEFTDVLMVGDKSASRPWPAPKWWLDRLPGARPHLIVFKKRRRQNSRRKTAIVRLRCQDRTDRRLA